ncbi:P-loop containing nucleoside triphosphate hydrolase protein [Scenedesmus sp. NREL 46B-D3]|nr:P-loop containing nucleoside triphosphate hydrolase protein [Scenedesmus sp. NREL 46B-D3]
MKQKDQQRVLQAYRDGEFNVLLATCIGEEGLDIPQVDLIICWDASSPSRMRQREGRTGRSRPGRVVCLLSEGREQQHYEDNHAKEQLVKAHLRASNFDAYKSEVAMLPPDITPTPTLVTLPDTQQTTHGPSDALLLAAAGQQGPRQEQQRSSSSSSSSRRASRRCRWRATQAQALQGRAAAARGWRRRHACAGRTRLGLCGAREACARWRQY